MKVAIYVRVSTNKQDIDNQIGVLEEFCKKSEWEIYKIYWDITSGSKDSRPMWDEMFRDAHKKLFDVVLFWSYDRFSRSGTLFTLQKLHELELLGIGYKSYQEQYIDSVGMFKDTVISILATIAKAERERVSERTKMGLPCICGHKRSVHNPICTKCDCKEFHGTGHRNKDKKPRKPRNDRGIKRK
jgi:DNA invertase Pin-like site-specific DNA recombinase